jgi:hypothetical protein
MFYKTQNLIITIILGIILFLILSTSNLNSQTITSLQGMEDYRGNTNLFYRINESLYDLNVVNGSDSIIFFGDTYNWINDYDFWNSDPSKYIIAETFNNQINFTGVVKKYNGSAFAKIYEFTCNASDENGIS